jgi:hypothetical protein
MRLPMPPKKLKPFNVGDTIGRIGTDEVTKIVQANRYQFWTENNWTKGGNLLEGGNWNVFFVTKKRHPLFNLFKLLK